LLRTQRKVVPPRTSAGTARRETAPDEPLPLLADPLDAADEAGEALPPLLPRGEEQDGEGDDEPADELQVPSAPASALAKLDSASEVREPEPAANGRAVVRYLASTVADFCNDPAVQASEGWRVRIALNEELLPSTLLHLSLSLHWLLLRFECGDERSKAAISAHREALQSALEEVVAPRREVSIDID
jgi:Type III secretion protein (HpaP)